ncbi:hypothetical protein FB446DRAFT_721154 [Lentinula raphanica]|nr:hypothetical protein FB446DRAFT_721154 [Lentinula raphanica]
MRILNPLRTPSMRLFAYLLLFFGCASNLFTAALPVTQPDSNGAVTRPANASALVPRDNKHLVPVMWTTFGESESKDKSHILSQDLYSLVKTILQKEIEKALKEKFNIDVLDFFGDLKWTTESKAYFTFSDIQHKTFVHVPDNKYGMLYQESLSNGLFIRYTITLYDSLPKNDAQPQRVGKPDRFDMPLTFVLFEPEPDQQAVEAHEGENGGGQKSPEFEKFEEEIVEGFISIGAKSLTSKAVMFIGTKTGKPDDSPGFTSFRILSPVDTLSTLTRGIISQTKEKRQYTLVLWGSHPIKRAFTTSFVVPSPNVPLKESSSSLH